MNGSDPLRVAAYRNSPEYLKAPRRIPGRIDRPYRSCKLVDKTELWDIPGDSCMLASINLFFGVIVARTLKEMATEICFNKNRKTGKYRLMSDIKLDDETGEPVMLMNVYNPGD
jgi:hypothetical protein